MTDGTSLPSFDSVLRDRPPLFSGSWTISAPNVGAYLRDPLRASELMPTVALLWGSGREYEKNASIEFFGYPLHFIDEALGAVPSRLEKLMRRTTSLELWMPRSGESRRLVPDRSPDLTLDRLWPFLGAARGEEPSENDRGDLERETSFESEELQKTVARLLYAMGAERVDEPSGMVMADGCPTNGIFATFPEFHTNVCALAFPTGSPVGAREVSAAVERAHARDSKRLDSVTYPWIVAADAFPKEVVRLAAYARVALTDLRGLMALAVRYGVDHSSGTTS